MDVISRGCPAEFVMESQLWVCGPPFPTSGDLILEDMILPQCAVMEKKKGRLQLETSSRHPRTASWTLQDLVCGCPTIICIRYFCKNLQGSRELGNLGQNELVEARAWLLQQVQRIHFGEELDALQQRGALPKQSSITKLCPFSGEDSLLCS